MARETKTRATPAELLNTAATEPVARRNEKVGLVVSTKMQKTIVVETEMRKAHPKYKRVMKSNKKFYAHDEQNSARVGDMVRIREARPLSKLKRWNARRDHPPLVACRASPTKSRRRRERRAEGSRAGVGAPHGLHRQTQYQVYPGKFCFKEIHHGSSNAHHACRRR